MNTRIYVPADAAARSVGADVVAEAIVAEASRRGVAIELVRNGSRGMLWLETLVEVVTGAGRVAYGPVAPEDVASLFDAGFLTGGAHPLGHGVTEQLPWLAKQDRLVFARVGVIDPLSVADWQAHGGGRGLRKALGMAPAEIVVVNRFHIELEGGGGDIHITITTSKAAGNGSLLLVPFTGTTAAATGLPQVSMRRNRRFKVWLQPAASRGVMPRS